MVGKTKDVRSPDLQVTRSKDDEGKTPLKEVLRHPFPGLRQKLKETHLYDVKVVRSICEYAERLIPLLTLSIFDMAGRYPWKTSARSGHPRIIECMLILSSVSAN